MWHSIRIVTYAGLLRMNFDDRCIFFSFSLEIFFAPVEKILISIWCIQIQSIIFSRKINEQKYFDYQIFRSPVIEGVLVRLIYTCFWIIIYFSVFSNFSSKSWYNLQNYPNCIFNKVWAIISYFLGTG